mgnify:CR=1 FL=1
MGRTVQLVLHYDGAGFAGWQRQSTARSVQGVLEEALTRLCGEHTRAIGAGRTDAGVHARGQAADRAQQSVLPSDVSADDTFLIVYTSGTTGFPKGAMHSQKSFVTGGEAFVQRVYLQDDDRVMIVLPLFHINAPAYSVLGSVAALEAYPGGAGYNAAKFGAAPAGT